jgi:hypothetical protein
MPWVLLVKGAFMNSSQRCGAARRVRSFAPPPRWTGRVAFWDATTLFGQMGRSKIQDLKSLTRRAVQRGGKVSGRQSGGAFKYFSVSPFTSEVRFRRISDVG